MIDKDKIIKMTKLAIYDKNIGEKDKKKMTYFCNDYVYRQNVGVRFGAFVGCMIVILFYVMHKIVIENADIITGIDYNAELIGISMFVIIVLVVYSVIGTIVHTADFQKANKRIKKYLKTIDELDKKA